MSEKPERSRLVAASYLFLRQRNEILMGVRQNTGYQDGMWHVPAGHVNMGESPRRAIIREGEEEVGIIIRLEDLHLVHILHRAMIDDTGERIDFFFEASRWSGNIENREPHKCRGWEWKPRYSLPRETTFHVRHGLLLAEKGVFYSELSAEAMKRSGKYEAPV